MATSSPFAFAFPDPDADPYAEMPMPRVITRRREVLQIVPDPIPLDPNVERFPPLAENAFPFEDCPAFTERGGCQIVLHQHYEGSRGDILRCKTCNRTFSSRRNGVLFKSRLPQDMVEKIAGMFGDGMSIRQAAKELNLNRGTVRRYYRLLGKEEI